MNSILTSINNYSVLITAIATVILVCVTFVYVWLTNKMLKQEQKGQQIAFIERKLEKLYCPLKVVLKRFDIDFVLDNLENIKNVDRGNDDQRFKYIVDRCWYFKKDFDKTVPFLYLASNELQDPLNEFIGIFENNKLFVEKWDNLEDIDRYSKAVYIKNNGAIDDLKANKDIIFDWYFAALKEIDEETISLKDELNKLVL